MPEPHDYYIWQADVYCPKCTFAIKRRLQREGLKPAKPRDQATYDSDQWPKGPFSDEEADTPQHCGSGENCADPTVLSDGSKVGKFFENPLTRAGIAYVIEKAKGGVTPAVRLWLDFYGDYPELDGWEGPLPTEPEAEDLVTRDYRRWHSFGGPRKLTLTTDPDRWLAELKAHMGRTKFWPNAWFIGERGDANLLDLESGGYAAERKV
jgi:hypothetical protein